MTPTVERELYRRTAEIAVATLEKLTDYLMTREPTQEPTIADVLSAVQNFGADYHQVHLALITIREEVQGHRAESHQEREEIRNQIDGLRGDLRSLQRQLDARLDQVWREYEQLRADVAGMVMRLNDLTKRIEELEAARANELEVASANP